MEKGPGRALGVQRSHCPQKAINKATDIQISKSGQRREMPTNHAKALNVVKSMVVVYGFLMANDVEEGGDKMESPWRDELIEEYDSALAWLGSVTPRSRVLSKQGTEQLTALLCLEDSPYICILLHGE
jgi:hypothetical protein